MGLGVALVHCNGLYSCAQRRNSNEIHEVSVAHVTKKETNRLNNASQTLTWRTKCNSSYSDLQTISIGFLFYQVWFEHGALQYQY